MNIKQLGRWPLLLAAILCIAGAVYIYRHTQDPNDGKAAANMLVIFAAFMLGGFLVDWAQRNRDDDGISRTESRSFENED